MDGVHFVGVRQFHFDLKSWKVGTLFWDVRRHLVCVLGLLEIHSLL